MSGRDHAAQPNLDLPTPTQAAEVKQRIAATDITIDHHRPMVNGRKIWGRTRSIRPGVPHMRE